MLGQRPPDARSRAGVPVLSTTPPDDGAGLPPAGANQPATPPTQSRAAADTAKAQADAAVVVDDVTMRFDDQLAVDGISLVVPAGTILGLIGPSGSGKTTTIRLLTGALTPTSGTVRVLGEEPRRFRRQTRERLGYMPQSFTLYPDLTVRENVDFVGSLFGMMFPRRRRRTREVLQLLDLWDVRSRRAGRLSGGMQRRLELACALVHDPALLFLDEPTAGIDPLLRASVWEELHRLRATGRTMLVTTQYINEAESCDLVALIAGGRLLALATPDDLRREASGGDVIGIETAALFDGGAPRGPAVRPRRPPDRAPASHGHRRRCRAGHARRGRRDPGARRRGRERPRGATLVRRRLHGARRTGPGRARPGCCRRRRRAEPIARPSRSRARAPARPGSGGP